VRLSPQPSAGVPGPNGQSRTTWRLRLLYDCADICGRTRTNEGRMKDRAACRCSLPGFDPARWDPAVSLDAAAQVEALADELRALASIQGVGLDFDLDRDGCPYGWMVSRFAGSVMDYVGRRDSDSIKRDINVRLLGRIMRDPEEPTRLLDWVRYAETIEDGAYQHGREVASS
jgi:hypothetical protein